MTFDPTFTASGVLIAITNLLFIVVYILRMEGSIKLLSQRLTGVESSIEALIKTDVRLATIEERLTNHVKMLTTAQQDISDLRRGDGFIRNRSAGGIDGEYPK